MIADCVPLLDENRIVVRHGLARLQNIASLGLKALVDASGLGRKKDLCATDVSFAIAPRLNAAGRLGCARLVIELLTTTSQERALELTRFLDGQNAQRQQIERRILEQAREMVTDLEMETAAALVLASSDWHPGVIGIVAGRLAELYARPVLLIALRDSDKLAVGSGRSVPGFSLHEALRACSNGLASHGGHAAAAGFKIAPEHVDIFRERFCDYVAKSAAPKQGPRLDLDAEIPLAALTPSFVSALDRLEPFGAGNPRPKFLTGPVTLAGAPRAVGKTERHLQFRIRQERSTFPVIAFNFADRLEELMSAGGECCLAFTPTFNEWQGYRTIQLEMLDFQAGPRARLG
jgi:single-stranded-DNA-specific exonuclease